MRMPLFIAGAASIVTQLALAPASVAQTPSDIPAIAQALLDAAYATGDAGEVAAVSKAVKAVFPDFDGAITDQAGVKIAEFTPPPEEEAAEAEAAIPTGGLFAVGPWEGKARAGASFASGNSDNLAVGIGLEASRTAGDFVHNVSLFYDVAESNDVTTQNRFGGAYQLDYAFSDDLYAYGRISYEDDAFSGFDYRLFAGGGIGYFLARSENFTWNIEGGPGYRISPIDDTRETLRDFAAYASSEIDWVIREGVVLEQDFFVTWTSPTTTFQSITTLTTALTENIATSFALDYRYETDPPFGNENSDTTARASVVYGF